MPRVSVVSAGVVLLVACLCLCAHLGAAVGDGSRRLGVHAGARKGLCVGGGAEPTGSSPCKSVGNRVKANCMAVEACCWDDANFRCRVAAPAPTPASGSNGGGEQDPLVTPPPQQTTTLQPTPSKVPSRASDRNDDDDSAARRPPRGGTGVKIPSTSTFTSTFTGSTSTGSTSTGSTSTGSTSAGSTSTGSTDTSPKQEPPRPSKASEKSPADDNDDDQQQQKQKLEGASTPDPTAASAAGGKARTQALSNQAQAQAQAQDQNAGFDGRWVIAASWPYFGKGQSKHGIPTADLSRTRKSATETYRDLAASPKSGQQAWAPAAHVITLTGPARMSDFDYSSKDGSKDTLLQLLRGQQPACSQSKTCSRRFPEHPSRLLVWILSHGGKQYKSKAVALVVPPDMKAQFGGAPFVLAEVVQGYTKRHVMVASDADGMETEWSEDDLLPALQELASKGTKILVVLDSCYGGALGYHSLYHLTHSVDVEGGQESPAKAEIRSPALLQASKNIVMLTGTSDLMSVSEGMANTMAQAVTKGLRAGKTIAEIYESVREVTAPAKAGRQVDVIPVDEAGKGKFDGLSDGQRSLTRPGVTLLGKPLTVKFADLKKLLQHNVGINAELAGLRLVSSTSSWLGEIKAFGDKDMFLQPFQ